MLIGMIALFLVAILSMQSMAALHNGCHTEQREVLLAQPRQHLPPCHFVSKTYTPSALEHAWLSNANSWQEHFCGDYLKQFDNATQVWLASISALAQSHASHGLQPEVFSSWIETYKCGDELRSHQTWIEPLSHGLRHPDALCGRGADIVARDHLLLAFVSDVAAVRQWITPSNRCGARDCQTLFFDLGASTWLTGAGGPSQSWFDQSYREHGITLDRMLLWEAAPTSPDKIFSSLPKSIWHKYQVRAWFMCQI